MGQEGKISVINYLDKNVVIKEKKLEKMSSKKLQKAFPETDELNFKLWKKEWRVARQAMVDMKF